MESSSGRFCLSVRGADPDIFLLMWDLAAKDKLLQAMRSAMQGFEIASDSGAFRFLFPSRADAEASAAVLRKAYRLTVEILEEFSPESGVKRD